MGDFAHHECLKMGSADMTAEESTSGQGPSPPGRGGHTLIWRPPKGVPFATKKDNPLTSDGWISPYIPARTLLAAAGFAPAARSVRRASRWPKRAAQYEAVRPFWSIESQEGESRAWDVGQTITGIAKGRPIPTYLVRLLC